MEFLKLLSNFHHFLDIIFNNYITVNCILLKIMELHTLKLKLYFGFYTLIHGRFFLSVFLDVPFFSCLFMSLFYFWIFKGFTEMHNFSNRWTFCLILQSLDFHENFLAIWKYISNSEWVHCMMNYIHCTCIYSMKFSC